MSEQLRISVIGPDYRSSHLVHAYILNCTADDNVVLTGLNEENDQIFKLSVPYAEAGDYQVRISDMAYPDLGEQFLLGSIAPKDE